MHGRDLFGLGLSLAVVVTTYDACGVGVSSED